MFKQVRVLLPLLSIATSVNAEYRMIGGRRLWSGYADAKATIRAIDADGVAVCGATVNARVFDSKCSGQYRRYSGETDANGLFVVEGRAISELQWEIVKRGYYKGSGDYDFGEAGRALKDEVIDGKWQPWNPTLKTTVMQMRKPIPMCAKMFRGSIPDDTSVGFDFGEGDWVAPYGTGRIADLSMTMKRRLQDRFGDVTYAIKFTNALDGVVPFTHDTSGRELGSDYIAPVDGYVDRCSYHYQRSTGSCVRSFTPDGSGLYFRVRSTTNAYGQITSAHFGKIYGHIDLGGFHESNARVEMKFYFNPTPNDRNVEFDPKRNLFRKLSVLEQVYEP